MGREKFVNQEFEYFDITVYPTEGKEVIDLEEDTVAIVQNGRVRFNQLDVFAKNEFDYQTVYLDKQAIIDLAEYLKNK